MEVQKCRYPTTITNDFNANQIQKSCSILSQPLDKIHSSLCELLSDHNHSLLTCILRHLLDAPITESSISIIGWYFINSLIPVPTAFYFIKEMINLLNASGNSPTDNGFVLNHLFARAIFSKLPKYTVYCKALLAHPCLQCDNELYIAIKQFSHEPVPIEYVDSKIYFVQPHEKKFFVPITFNETILPLPEQDPSIKMKNNLFNSIEYARSLDPDQQRLYCVNICLTYPPTSLKIRFLPFLSAICSYSKLLLLQVARNSWDAFETHPQLERMGSWLGVLTNSQGRPPPLYMLNIPKLLRETIDCGAFGHAMIFLTAFYSKVLNLFQPPHPITNLVLEILAAVLNTPGIRTDIIEKIQKFGDLLKVDVSFYYNRSINIPENSFDRYAQFSNESDSVVFKPASQLNKENECDVQFCLNSYFHYVPNHIMLPLDQQQIFNQTQRIEKYYFLDTVSVISPHTSQYADQETLQYIVSLAIADSPILAKTASRLFHKITKDMNPLDLAQIFRCAFPNKYIFTASLRSHCFPPSNINSLFSELLTNPYTAPIAKPLILEFMPFCFEYYPDYSFASLKELTKTNPLTNHNKQLPKPNPSHINLLRAFLSFSRSRDDSNRSDFSSKMSKITADHIVSLMSFVLYATIKRNSPKTSSTIDYSPIDSLCFALGKCAGRIDNDSLIPNCIQAIMSIAPAAIEKQPKALFRLVNGLFGWLHFRSNLKLIDLLYYLSPFQFPSFALCWIQLVMHRAAFPNFIRTNETRPLQFCLNFVIICLKLCVEYPDIFYRSVCRILITIASSPLFFISYHQLLLEFLPLRFVQFRNIILGTSFSENTEDLSPPIGFDFKETLKAKAVIQVIDSILQKKEKDREKLNNNAVFLTSLFKRAILENGTNNNNNILYQNPRIELLNINSSNNSSDNNNNTNSNDENNLFIPRIIWQFVFYCVKKSADMNVLSSFNSDDSVPSNSFLNLPVVNLFSLILASPDISNDTTSILMTVLIEAIVDQLRYANKHTTFASYLLFALFQKADKNVRELILVTLIKRLLCVTSPPQSVRKFYQNLSKKFDSEIKELLEENNEFQLFKMVKEIIE